MRKSRCLYSKREHIKTVKSWGNLRWARVIRLMHRLYYELATISAAFEPPSHYRTCVVSKTLQHLPLNKEQHRRLDCVLRVPFVLRVLDVSSSVFSVSVPIFSRVMVSCCVSPLNSCRDTLVDRSSLDR